MKKLITLGLLILIVLSGCLSTPAREVTNICDLLDEKVSWYNAVKKNEEEWGAPMHWQVAISQQESHFASNARPPRNKIFGIIPGARPTTSFGYTQAKRPPGIGINLRQETSQLNEIILLTPLTLLDGMLINLCYVLKLAKQMPTASIWLIMTVMAVITIRLMKIRLGSLMLLKMLKRSLIPIRVNCLNVGQSLIRIACGHFSNYYQLIYFKAKLKKTDIYIEIEDY